MKFFYVCLVVFLGIIDAALSKTRSDCVCGEANVKGVGRIVNGKTTIPNKYPWMAAMYTQHAFMCGGAIISDRNIITAGHCIFYVPDAMQTHWVLGMHDSNRKDGAVYYPSHAELHPKFTNHTVYDDFDIAMITLSKAIRFGPTVRPICLPAANAAYAGQYAQVSGWGRLNEGEHANMASLLQEANIKVKRNDDCAIEVKRLVRFNPQSMICGYESKVDACQGDSGGPFFIETDPNRFELFGVVSFGDGCGRKFPGIYAKLSEPSTLKWIKNYMRKSKGDVCTDPRKIQTNPRLLNAFHDSVKLLPE